MSDDLKSAHELNKLPADAVLVDLTKRVKMYAPASSTNHAPFEEIQVGTAVVDKFISQGYTTEKPKESAKKEK